MAGAPAAVSTLNPSTPSWTARAASWYPRVSARWPGSTAPRLSSAAVSAWRSGTRTAGPPRARHQCPPPLRLTRSRGRERGVVILSPRDLLTHAPVLLHEVVEYLAVQPGGRYVDCPTGAGGHARAVMEAAAPGGLLLGLDADPVAISVASQNLASFGDSVQLVESNFRDLKRACRSHNFVPVHGILFDLGISSMQLADERGFSFQGEAPLDMRFNPGQVLTAGDIVNHYAEQDLADVIWRFGEERASRRIA